jgi:lysophospholipase L1-like esterase
VFERFVVIGDSTAEGIGDPDRDGAPRGFGNRLAERIAAQRGTIEYANLAVSGYVAREVRERQLQPALAMRPDLAAIMAGMNDLLRARFDARAIAADVAAMQQALVATGCTVLSFTLPDVAHRLVMPPLSRALSRRTQALNAELRRVSRGVHLVDLAAYPVAIDPRMWNRDRLHGSPEGHERVAAACAWSLALPGADVAWREALPAQRTPSLGEKLVEDLAWARAYLAPWLWHRVRGRPGIAQRVAKRPVMGPL